MFNSSIRILNGRIFVNIELGISVNNGIISKDSECWKVFQVTKTIKKET